MQIGENISKEDLQEPMKFEEELEKMLGLFPNSRKILTIPFWTVKEKSYVLTNVAMKSRSALVDLSHLGSGSDDPKNLANSIDKYRDSRAGTHPGDYGMENIAKCIRLFGK